MCSRNERLNLAELLATSSYPPPPSPTSSLIRTMGGISVFQVSPKLRSKIIAYENGRGQKGFYSWLSCMSFIKCTWCRISTRMKDCDSLRGPYCVLLRLESPKQWQPFSLCNSIYGLFCLSSLETQIQTVYRGLYCLLTDVLSYTALVSFQLSHTSGPYERFEPMSIHSSISKELLLGNF